MERRWWRRGERKWSLKNFLIRSIDRRIFFWMEIKFLFVTNILYFNQRVIWKFNLRLLISIKTSFPPFFYTRRKILETSNCNSRAKETISFNWLKNTSDDKIRGKNLIDRVRKIRVWLAVRTARIEFRASVISDDFCRGRGNPRENKRFERKRFSSRHFPPAVERAHTSP